MVRIRGEPTGQGRHSPRREVQSPVGRIGSLAMAPLRYLGRQWGSARSRLARSPVGRNTAFRFILRVIHEMDKDDATHMAASVAYYAILSLFPLIMGVSALVGLLVRSQDQQQAVVNFVISYLPGSEQFVRNSVQGLVRLRGTLGIVAIFGLLWTASAVFGAVARAVNRAWDIHHDRPFYQAKPRQLAMAVAIGLMFFISLAFTSAVQWATSIHIDGRSIADILGGRTVTWVLRPPSLLISVGIFMAMYKYVPNTKTRWGDIWPGALFAALAFEAAKSFFVLYLQRFARYDHLYGDITSVVVLMSWIYLSALIIIIGAEIASEYAKVRQGAPEVGQANTKGKAPG